MATFFFGNRLHYEIKKVEKWPTAPQNLGNADGVRVCVLRSSRKYDEWDCSCYTRSIKTRCQQPLARSRSASRTASARCCGCNILSPISLPNFSIIPNTHQYIRAFRPISFHRKNIVIRILTSKSLFFRLNSDDFLGARSVFKLYLNRYFEFPIYLYFLFPMILVAISRKIIYRIRRFFNCKFSSIFFFIFFFRQIKRENGRRNRKKRNEILKFCEFYRLVGTT